tara:strand:+ start:1476 stop:2138 length:663 start_codon:yes stop_codon:yes gene_type:complete
MDNQEKFELAYQCVVLSVEAYSRHHDLSRINHELLNVYDKDHTQAIVTTNGKLKFLAYRGSESAKDFLNDLKYVKTDWEKGGRVHAGFKRAYEALDIEEEVDVVTGHSLGGAVALLRVSDRNAKYAFTFGCPRVGNQNFKPTIKCPVFRFVNHLDTVTHVPPPTSFVQAFNALRNLRTPSFYNHIGEKIGLSGYRHSSDQYEEGVLEILSDIRKELDANE